MSTRKQRLISTPPLTSLTSSPALSAVHPSPLVSGTLPPFPVTASSFASSPTLSSATQRSVASPDYFEDFAYSSDMDEDIRRIEREHTLVSDSDSDTGEQPPEGHTRSSKTWVVFHGRIPGIYEDSLCAIMQSQSYSDGYQRVFPDRDTAEIAWNAFVRDGTFPDYGRGPWVVFLGRRPGVYTRISELEGCVKGYENAIFRSCSSVSEGNIKFQLFIQRVVEMFNVHDPFSGVDAIMPPSNGGARKVNPVAQPATPVQGTSTRPQHFSPSQVAQSSKAAGKRRAASPSQKSKIARPGDGWYVVHTGVLPGVYYGVSALKKAKPNPGGFVCAPDQAEADQLFMELTVNCGLTFVKDI